VTIDKLGLNDIIYFKNGCGGTTHPVYRDIADVLYPNNTADTLEGPWEVSTDDKMKIGTVCKQGTDECVSWTLRKC